MKRKKKIREKESVLEEEKEKEKMSWKSVGVKKKDDEGNKRTRRARVIKKRGTGE